MQGMIRTALLAVLLASGAAAMAQPQAATPAAPPPEQAATPPTPATPQAATPATAADAAAGPRFGPPAAVTAAPIPSEDDTNARRARTQPGNNAPFWRGVRESGEAPGFTTLPGAEKGVLIQPFVQYPGSDFTNAGEAWRQVRNQWIVPYGGALIIIALLAVALMYFAKGPLGHAENRGGRIERFTPFERAAHWVNAIAFCVLAISGIVMAFGRFFLLPIVGQTVFGWLTYVLKNLHNFAGPLFAVSLLIVIVTFIRDNVPRKGDMQWLMGVRGMLRGKEVPSHRFNAGEKVIFWLGTLLFGVIVVGSGLVMDMIVPGLAYLRSDMQIAHIIHSVSAALMIVFMTLHIYLGTVGVRGAYRGMRQGDVTDEWAREHHELWYRDIQTGKIPVRRSRDASAPRPATQPR
jgi:formate dehydrogenase subunit gamma